MWPMLLNLTRDECRQTLRRLELEAYSNMISVFRAQGALEDNRKKLLEELRAVLHISNDRHSAEARRVSNDELLATIAEQLAGPNTGLGWISEGRRRIPLLPRGIAQTMYTEIADKAAEAAATENKELKKKLEAEKLVAPKSNEEELSEAEGQTAEGALSSNETTEDMLYPPIAMEDQTSKLWETEIITRKRKLPEGGAIPENTTTPVKNMRNIPLNTNQKHLNLSQIYSKFSQPASSKPSGQSKHSYNQVSKVSTSKSNQPHSQRPAHKHRSHKQSAKNSAQAAMSKSQMKKKQELSMSPGKQYNPTSMQLDYSGPPNTFQASYAQSVLGNKPTKADYMEEIKSKGLTSPGMMTDSPTLQLLSQPATVPHELGVSDNVHPDDPTTLQAQGMSSTKHLVTKNPCHLIIKKRGEITPDKKVQMSELKILQKPSEGIKVLSNRQVVVAPSSTQKALSTGKLVTTKVISSVGRAKGRGTPALTDKMIVVSKPSAEMKALSNSKIIITSSVTTPAKDIVPISTNSISPRTTETFTPKGIPTTDLKVSAKAVVLNPKSGQKMVVLPAKARTKPGSEGQLPLLHFKGLSTAMKLVPVSCQAATPATKSAALTVMSKPTVVAAIASSSKIVNMEPIRTANLADIVPVKGLTPVTTPKITHPIVRTTSGKGSVIVVQKGATIGKALTFAKNGNDMSKIIMGKNINQLLQASKTDPTDASKCAGNVIVLELNNEQTGRTTTMSEILDSRHTSVAREPDEDKITQITQDTPVLFENPITDDTCNASSLDSTADSISGIEPLENSSIPMLEKEGDKSSSNKDVEGGKDSSSVTDWEMELDTVSRKGKDDDDKLNSLHLDLGMSSESENEYMVDSHKCKSKHSSQESIPTATVSGDSSEIYGGSSGLSLATRTLLSQLQDDGSSSNDSSFALKAKVSDKLKESDTKIDKSESEALTKAKEKLSEKVAKSQQKRIDLYSTAISSSDITLDSFSYLEESMMAGDDVFCAEETKREPRRADALADQLCRLLGEDSAHSAESQTVSESLPLTK